MYGRGHVRTELSGESVPKTKPDEACRWLPRPEHALAALAKSRQQPQTQVIPMTTHTCLYSLCEALDVSRTEL